MTINLEKNKTWIPPLVFILFGSQMALFLIFFLLVYKQLPPILEHLSSGTFFHHRSSYLNPSFINKLSFITYLKPGEYMLQLTASADKYSFFSSLSQ